jgi:hypothetical protein
MRRGLAAVARGGVAALGAGNAAAAAVVARVAGAAQRERASLVHRVLPVWAGRAGPV